MELSKGVTVEYADGAVVLKAEIKSLVAEKLADVKAKLESGEIDLIKGTDLDKISAIKVIEAIEKAI